MKSIEEMSNEADWAAAVLHFKEGGQRDPLADLLRSNRPIPALARPWLAQIVTGEIKLANQRGKANSKLTFAQTEEFRNRLFMLWVNTEFVLIFVDDLADEMAKEIIDLRNEMEKLRRDALRKAAREYDVSENTIRSHIHIAKSTALALSWAGIKNEWWPTMPIGGDPQTAKYRILERVRPLLSGPASNWERFPE